MAGDEFERLVGLAMAEPVEGWSFPFLEARIEREAPSWDWAGMAREPLRGARTALDHRFQLDDYREQLLRVRHLDIAAVVFAVRSTPWAAGEFPLQRWEPRLRELHERMPLVTASTAVFVRATKPPQ